MHIILFQGVSNENKKLKRDLVRTVLYFCFSTSKELCDCLSTFVLLVLMWLHFIRIWNYCGNNSSRVHKPEAEKPRTRDQLGSSVLNLQLEMYIQAHTHTSQNKDFSCYKLVTFSMLQASYYLSFAQAVSQFLPLLCFSPFQEEIQKKTGYIVRRGDGTFDVDANTSIDHLSEELGIKIPEVLFLIRYLAFSTVAMDSLGHVCLLYTV